MFFNFIVKFWFGTWVGFDNSLNSVFIFSEDESEIKNIKMILEELDIYNYTLQDCMIIKRVCKVVSTRAAYLSAAGSFIVISFYQANQSYQYVNI